MKPTFTYDRHHDIWCLLHYGKTSTNSSASTKIYEELVTGYGKNPSDNDASEFIEAHLTKNNLTVENLVKNLQENWEKISTEYHKRAENIFGVIVPHDITAYLTINTRCPYDMKHALLYVSTTYPDAVNKTAMHELWHFYTWYKYGSEWEKKLGTEKYNEIKEALTVLLNVECQDLLPEGITDKGYPQHQELRQKILELWSKNKNMETLWNILVR